MEKKKRNDLCGQVNSFAKSREEEESANALRSRCHKPARVKKNGKCVNITSQPIEEARKGRSGVGQNGKNSIRPPPKRKT